MHLLDFYKRDRELKWIPVFIFKVIVAFISSLLVFSWQLNPAKSPNTTFGRDYLQKHCQSIISTENEFTSSTNTPWFAIRPDRGNIKSISFVVEKITLANTPLTQSNGAICYAGANHIFYKKNTIPLPIKVGVNHVMLPRNDIKAIRIDMGDKANISFVLNEVTVNGDSSLFPIRQHYSLFSLILALGLALVIVSTDVFFLTWAIYLLAILAVKTGFNDSLLVGAAFLVPLFPVVLFLKKYWRRLIPQNMTTEFYLLSSCAIFYLSWSIIIPYNSAPDEILRYQLCEYISQHLEIPVGYDPALRSPEWGMSYAFLPITPSIIGGLLMRLATEFGLPSGYLFHIARIPSLICGLITVFFAMRTIKFVFISPRMQIIAIAVFAFWPQFVFLCSYLNNDIFAIMCIMIATEAVFRGVKQKWPLSACVQLAIGFGLGLISYFNAYPLFFVLGVIYLLSSFRTPSFGKKSMLIFTIAFLLSGWWFARNVILYDGDILGLKSLKESSARFAPEHLKPANILTLAKQGLDDLSWYTNSLKSFFGTFDYLNRFLPQSIYTQMLLLAIAALLGCLGYGIHLIGKTAHNGTSLWNKKTWIKHFVPLTMSICLIISLMIHFYHSYAVVYAPQGRYVMGSFFSVIFFLVSGLCFWDMKFSKRTLVCCQVLFFTVFLSSLYSLKMLLEFYY